MKKSSVWIIILTAIITSIITSVFLPLQKIIESNFAYRQLNVANVTTYWQQRLATIIDFSKYASGLNTCLSLPVSEVGGNREERFVFCYDNYATPLLGVLRETDLRFGGNIQDDTEKIDKTLHDYLDAYLTEDEYSENEQKYRAEIEALELHLLENINTQFRTFVVQE